MTGNRRLLIAIGNPLRGDDGAAQHVLDQVKALCERWSVQQLTPELAATVATFDEVCFLDADCRADAARLTALAESGQPEPPAIFTHLASAAAVIEAARQWYGFQGQAWLCSIPTLTFGPGEPLSAVAEQGVRDALLLLDRLWPPDEA